MEFARRRDRIAGAGERPAHWAGDQGNWARVQRFGCAPAATHGGAQRNGATEDAVAPCLHSDAAAVAAALPRYANEMLWFFNGNERMRLPVAAKNALSTAGAATKMVGSPTPPQKPPEGTIVTSTFGISLMRIEL